MTETDFFEPFPEEIRNLYSRLHASLKKIGPFRVEVKKTSLHLVHAKGFAGIHPKKSYLGVNLVLAREVTRPKAATIEQISASRYHLLFKLTEPGQITPEFLKLTEEAYMLMGAKSGR